MRVGAAVNQSFGRFTSHTISNGDRVLGDVTLPRQWGMATKQQVSHGHRRCVHVRYGVPVQGLGIGFLRRKGRSLLSIRFDGQRKTCGTSGTVHPAERNFANR